MKKLLLLFAIIIFSNIIIAQVKVEIVVVTKQLNENENVFITGNTSELGNWNPGLISLSKKNDSTWNKVFDYPINSVLEFKFTKGDWGREALDNNGMVPGNTSLNITKDTIATYQISNWSNTRLNVTGQIIGLEERLQPGIDEMMTVLKEKGFVENQDLLFIKDPFAEHNESAWAKNVYRFLEFFFPVKE